MCLLFGSAVLQFKEYNNVWWSTEKLCNESTEWIDDKALQKSTCKQRQWQGTSEADSVSASNCWPGWHQHSRSQEVGVVWWGKCQAKASHMSLYLSYVSFGGSIWQHFVALKIYGSNLFLFSSIGDIIKIEPCWRVYVCRFLFMYADALIVLVPSIFCEMKK